MNYLIDSDYVADFLKGRAPATTLLTALFPDGVAISIITFAEIYEGIYYGDHPVEHQAAFRHFLRGMQVLTINRSIATRYAIIRGDLRGKGELLAVPDLFIGATALYHGLTLVTRNLRHYSRIPGLNIYTPDKP